MQWAVLAATIGVFYDGPELADSHRLYLRLKAACRSFGIPGDRFDECAARLDFHYVRLGDYYSDKEGLKEAAEIEALLASNSASARLH